jgi:hypothetical protein
MKKSLVLFLVFSLISFSLFAQQILDVQSTVSMKNLSLFGSIIAVVASWSRNQSILWAMLHGVLSWFYVIYFAVTR